jgi:hypothetical protein
VNKYVAVVLKQLNTFFVQVACARVVACIFGSVFYVIQDFIHFFDVLDGLPPLAALNRALLHLHTSKYNSENKMIVKCPASASFG